MSAGLKAKIKTGDNVIVIAGKDKGKSGVVKSVDTKNERVIVEGVNMVKRHQKANPMQEAGMVEKEAALHVSNVMVADPKSGKPTRVGLRTEGDKKVRFAKDSGETL